MGIYDLFHIRRFIFPDQLSLTFVALWILFSNCSDPDPVVLQVEKFVYTPGNPAEISISEPVKVNINGLGLEVNHTERPSQPLSNAFDKDLSTLYHSPWATDNPTTQFPVIITITLPENAPSFDYLLYYPRATGTNGRIIAGEMKISLSEAPTSFISIFQISLQGDGAPKKLPVPAQYRGKIRKIMLHITEGMGNFVSIQEIEFYREAIPATIPDIFSDNSCSSLKPGITRDQIEKITSSVFRNIGLSLFDGTYDMRRIGTYHSYIRPDLVAKENRTAAYGLLDNVTGIWVDKGDFLLVFVGDHSSQISLRIINHNGTTMSDFDGQQVDLLTGVNKVEAKISGLVYLIYHDDKYEQVKINISSGKINGYFDLEKHRKEDWTQILNNAVADRIDLLGKYTHLAFTTNELRKNTPDPVRLLQVYDSIVWIEEQFAGYYKYNRRNPTRLMYRVTPAATYMHAVQNRTEYNPSTMEILTNPSAVRTTGIWGPAHETGHMNQITPDFKWKGMTEVSVNIFSLQVQTVFGNPSRLTIAEDPYNSRYEKGFNEIIVPGIPHAKHPDVFCRLIPFWQLQLYFSQVKGKSEFYADLHEKLRNNPNPVSNGAAQIEFIRACSDVTQTNLSDFFSFWGLLTPVNMDIDDYGTGNLTVTISMIDELKAYLKNKGYPSPVEPVHPLRDNNTTLFKSPKAIVKGTATMRTSGPETTFLLTGWSNQVAFEIIINEILSYISTSDNFTVTLPTGAIKAFAVSASGERVSVNFQ